MAGLDLNELLNRSITNIVSEGKEEQDLSVDLENVEAKDEEATTTSEEETTTATDTDTTADLALDLESLEDQVELDLPENLMENLMGAVGAGIGTFAVLEAREAKRASAE